MGAHPQAGGYRCGRWEYRGLIGSIHDSDARPLPVFTEEETREILRLKKEISRDFEETTNEDENVRKKIYYKCLWQSHPDRHASSQFHEEVAKLITDQGLVYRKHQGEYVMPEELQDPPQEDPTSLTQEQLRELAEALAVSGYYKDKPCQHGCGRRCARP